MPTALQQLFDTGLSSVQHQTTMEQGAMEMNNVVAKQNHDELQGTE